MRYSKLVGKKSETLRRTRFSTAISYCIKADLSVSLLPADIIFAFGLAGSPKIAQVVREEMDKIGGQEMIVPVLHPLHLWQETNRTQSVGFELMTIKDGREFQFALGGRPKKCSWIWSVILN